MPRAPAPDFTTLSLSGLAQAVADKHLPPVDLWHPKNCGTSDMRIARDGSWYHQGSPIGRKALVQTFATILRREPDGSTVLVTPAEMLDIEVEDAHFIAVEVKSEGENEKRRLAFRLNTDEVVIASANHPIKIAQNGDEPRPYLHVRGTIGNGLTALITRSVYYELINLALEERHALPSLWSAGTCFSMIPTLETPHA